MTPLPPPPDEARDALAALDAALDEAYAMGADGIEGAQILLSRLAASGWVVSRVLPPAPGTVLRELDACKPLYNAAGPAQGGRTFSGWEVPDWLMLRVRSALATEPDRETTP